MDAPDMNLVQSWWIFQLPASRAYVPVPDRFHTMPETYAREVLYRDSYPHAPVHAWPCLGVVRCARKDLHG